MERKYLFFDIDGTLTDRATGKIVPSAKEALQRLEENGHFVAIATGRAHYKAEKFTKANGFKNMVCNGGNGLVINGELVMNIPLEKENCIRIIEEADKLGYGWCLVMDDTKDVYMKDTLFLEQVGKRKEPTRYIIEPEYLMFQPDNKRGGILNMVEYLKADKKDVVVFGDDYNDMDMFHSDWFSIAMGNGCQALKERADYVTDTNVNDGIKKACEHFGWI